MGNLIWCVIMVPCSAFFTGLGLYAYTRKKPMWFWSGSVVTASEITDVRAYNRANGRMWIGFSLVLWMAAAAIWWNGTAAVILLAAGCVIGIPVLALVYRRIYKKYSA